MYEKIYSSVKNIYVYFKFMSFFFSESILCDNSKIQAYEGSYKNQVDDAAYNAAKAIKNLVSNLSKSDLVIVLCSGIYI